MLNIFFLNRKVKKNQFFYLILNSQIAETKQQNRSKKKKTNKKIQKQLERKLQSESRKVDFKKNNKK